MPASLFTVMRDDVTLPVRVQSAGALGEWTDRCKDKRSHDRSDFIAKKSARNCAGRAVMEMTVYRA